MANILLIAGGKNQRQLAVDIVQGGHTLFLVDPYHNGPCTDLADIHIQCDTRHYLDIISEIELRRISIQGVTSDQSDASLLSVSKVSEYLGLKHMPSSVIKNCLNKFSQSIVLQEHGVIVPSTDLLPSNYLDDSNQLWRKYFKPHINKVIIKPSDSQGSKGVQIVSNRNDLIQNLHYTTKETVNGEVLIQEYIEGTEYSVDGVVLNNELHVLAIATKYHYANNACIDERNTFFGDISLSIYSRLIKSVDMAAKALRLNNTLIHAELVLSSYRDEIYLIEISPRGGGGSISSKIIPYITGYSPTAFLISRCLNQEYPHPLAEFKTNNSKYVVMRFLPNLMCSFRSLKLSNPQFSTLIHSEIPDGNGCFREIRDSRDRVGYFVIGNSDLGLLLNDEQHMLNSLQIIP